MTFLLFMDSVSHSGSYWKINSLYFMILGLTVFLGRGLSIVRSLWLVSELRLFHIMFTFPALEPFSFFLASFFFSWVTSHRPWFTQTETCTEYLRHTYMPSARSGTADVFISWLWFFCVVILPGGYGCCFSFSIHYYHQPGFSSLSVSF